MFEFVMIKKLILINDIMAKFLLKVIAPANKDLKANYHT